jgi:hypothetical protein
MVLTRALFDPVLGNGHHPNRTAAKRRNKESGVAESSWYRAKLVVLVVED